MAKRANPDLTRPAKCTVCVVDVQGGSQTHYKKITVELDPVTVMSKIKEILAGHIVIRKTGSKKPTIRTKKSVQ